MTKHEALEKIAELQKFIENLDKPIGFEDDIIFLLSVDEHKRYKDKISSSFWWWLRSPGYDSFDAASVFSDGFVLEGGSGVDDGYGAVRPALKYSKLKSEISESKDKDCFMWNETKWKIIDSEKEIAISVLPIGFRRFDKKSNDYRTSEIREWLLKWGGFNDLS